MKKTTLFSAMLALIAIASCQKEETSPLNSAKDPVFTAIIENGDAKTNVDAATKKVAWVIGDEITVTDASKTNSVKYTVTEINDGVATFKKKSGESGTLGDGPYTAVYGTAPSPSTSQPYSASAPSLPMTGESGASDSKLKFTVSCGLLEITLTQADESIKSISVSDNAETPNTYTLDCGTGVSIASGAKFYIAVPVGTYTTFQFTNGTDVVRGRSGLSIVVAANHIKPISSNFALKYTSGTTDADYGIKVGSTWWAPVNCGYDAMDYPYGKLYQWGRKDGCGYDDKSTYTETLIQEFDKTMTPPATPDEKKFYKYWKPTATEWSSSNDPCPAGWRVPTKDELSSLIAYKSNWKNGYYFSGSTAYSESVPRVFIPAAGFRYCNNGRADDRGDTGYYWSSSVNDDHAWYLSFFESEADLRYDSRAFGYSVRCVKE